MKIMKTVKVLIFVFILSALLASASTVTSIELDQGRPNVIFREHTQLYSNTIIKGNATDSSVDLLVNTATYVGQRLVIRGDANVTQTPSNITITGLLQATQINTVHSVISGIQNDQYIDDLPVDQRFRLTPRSRVDTTSIPILVDRTYPILMSFNDLQNNENVTEIVRDDLDMTAFLVRSGTVGSSPLVDREGNTLATVVGFGYTMSVVLYQTSTESIIGVHTESSVGYGNIFPSRVINYLNNQTFIRQIGDGVRGDSYFSGGNFISWIDAGYNETLGLQTYLAQFQMARTASTLLFSNQEGSGLALSAVSIGAELFLGSLEENNALVIDTNEVDEFEETVVENALEQDEVIIPTTSLVTSSETGTPDLTEDVSEASLDLNTAAIFGAQFFALIVVGNVLYRRFR